jgi:S-formylglutathione hydrolase FrmB
MKGKCLFVALALMAAVPGLAKSLIVRDSLESAVLSRAVKYNVYLPDGFEAAGKTYPVVYLLHGLYGNNEDWEMRGQMRTVLDELIGTGEAAEMVVIMPCAGDNDVRNVQNGYFNMPDCPYEDFFFNELIPGAEKKYHCGGSKGRRAVMGLSMGGGGSTVYCQRHPFMFSSCYAMSAWLDQRELDPDAPMDKLRIVSESVRAHSALDFIDNASPETVAALKTVKWFFDCGDDDFLLELSTELHLKMRAAGIKSELRVRNGVHNWEYWHTALRYALPFASRNFDR